MVEISDVQAGSIADEMGLSTGDKLIEINGQLIKDYIDYQYGIAADTFVLTVEKKDGQLWELEITKYPDENLGIMIDGIIYDQLKNCKNNCLFCFVKQQPEGMRETLCLKDDDYRFSFLQGSFITLTNLNDSEIKRILRLNLSPLYISVHTTNPSLRVKMMKNPEAAKIMEQLKLFAENGISFHTQIVLCPGYNDMQELDKSIDELISLYPQVLSIGIVPVGLTDFRNNLTDLDRYDNKGAQVVIDQISNWQKKLENQFDENFLYLSDEFYFLAEKEIPEYDHYNDFCQIENGIGLTRLFYNEFSNLILPKKVKNKNVGIITGELGNKALKPVIEELKKIKELTISTIPVINKFFGNSVTVTGLLTGEDIIKTLNNKKDKPDIIILPSIIFNNNGNMLDDLRLTDIKNEFPNIDFNLAGDMKEVLEVLER